MSLYRSALLVFCSVLLWPVFAAAQRNLAVAPVEANEQRVALVIGNSAYKEAPLRNPVNDATDMAATLRTLGFSVALRTNADTRQMRAAIREFAQNLRRGGVGLFYFAGHGVQSRNGKNYLIPVGADLKEEFELEDEAVDANRVLAGMEEAGNRVNIVILDACRNNPFARSWRSAVNGLAQMSAPTGSFVGFATAPGSVAADGTGRNGLYTQHLLQNLKQGDPDIDRVFTRVTAAVARETGNKQVPWKSSSLTGDFSFRTLALAPSSTPSASPDLPAAPAAGQYSLDDLKKRQASRAQWNKWQAQMKAAFDQTAKFKGASDLQAAAWERFLASYKDDNPHSSVDDELRAQALLRKQNAEGASAKQKEEADGKRTELLALAPSSTSAIQQSAGPGKAFRDCDVCPEMVIVPAGQFVMGSPMGETRRDMDEGPQHPVTVARAIAVGMYEVTFDEWDACVGEAGCSTKVEDKGWGRGRRPVINVAWHDAKQYTAWLSLKTGKNYRLLGEAEWEYAARAGTKTPFGTGESISPTQANFNTRASYAGSPTATEQGKTVPVGSYAANAFGLYDMHGNVWEWTEDCWNENYGGAPADGSAWTAGDCAKRILRGGSWYDGPRFVRSAQRNAPSSENRDEGSGFRVARSD